MKTRFAIITDFHFGPAKHDTPEYHVAATQAPACIEKIVTQLNEIDDLDFVINLGDLVQDRPGAPTRDEDLQNARIALGLLGKLQVPLYHVAGNHDLVTLSHQDLRELFQHDLYYSFNAGKHKHIVLHCESPGHKNVQLLDSEFEWLAREIAAADRDIIVYLHQLLVEHPLEGTSCEGMPDCAYLQNKEEICALLATSPRVRAVFNGHMHKNLFTVENGIPFISVQAATEPLINPRYTDNVALAGAFAVVEVSNLMLSCQIFGEDQAEFEHSSGSRAAGDRSDADG